MPDQNDFSGIELKVFNSGWVDAKKGMVLAGAGKEKIRMPALFAMIRHPRQGVILYDTGYNTRFYEATRSFPFSVLRLLTPARITEEDNADRQLAKAGVSAQEVSTIILGHGHVDHVPGIVDFPEAKVVVDRREWELMQGSTLAVFRKGYVKSLYRDIANQIELVDFGAQGRPHPPFDLAVDLWQDRSMILVPLPGHTPGQMGLWVNTPEKGSFLFIGDAAWLCENYLEIKPPARVARTILDSFPDFIATLDLLHNFQEDHPGVTIIPSHCPAAWERLQSMGIAA